VLRIFFISFFITVQFVTATCQVAVVDASLLAKYHNARYLPDVEGKVLVNSAYLNFPAASSNREGPEIFPGWPVSVDGSNECGGVYGNLDDDAGLEIIYSVDNMLYAFNPDGSVVDGWPQTLDFPTDGAAAFGDIDGDDVGEIVVTTHQTGTFAFGTLYAFEIDGSDVSGFPVTTDGGGVRNPTLGDLDLDGALEIIITVRDWPDGLVYVFYGDGSIYPGWPVRMDYVPGSAAAVGDIDNDDIPEIVAESYYGLHVFTPEGTLVQGFPYYPGPGRVFSYSTPVLADLEGDGQREIICGDHSTENGTGAVHIVENDGNSWIEWPKFTSYWVYGPPAVGDIDGDGQLDIAVGDQTLSENPVNQLYAWTALTGEPLEGFPVSEVFGINNQVILADLDGDERIELLVDDNSAINSMGNYPGFNHDGTKMDDWLLQTLGSTFFINPMVVDLNDDGITDISGGGTEEGTGVTNLYLWNTGVEFRKDLAVLPILQYNSRHNGVYGDTLMVGIDEQGSGEEGKQGSREEGKRGNVDIFPNPASSYINVSIISFDKNLQSGELQFTIYNLSGEEVFGKAFSSKTFKINLEEFPSGIYWITVCRNTRIEGFGKFVISR
jgi:hypothetical protein